MSCIDYFAARYIIIILSNPCKHSVLLREATFVLPNNMLNLGLILGMKWSRSIYMTINIAKLQMSIYYTLQINVFKNQDLVFYRKIWSQKYNNYTFPFDEPKVYGRDFYTNIFKHMACIFIWNEILYVKQN